MPSGDGWSTNADAGLRLERATARALSLAERLCLLYERERWVASSEAQYQEAFEAFLKSHHLRFEREVRLTATDRIDFLCLVSRHKEEALGLGVELKIRGSQATVRRQLAHYADSPRILGLLLVTTQLKLRKQPPTLNGKFLRVAHALPL